MWGVFF
jgi:hypothetical protein